MRRDSGDLAKDHEISTNLGRNLGRNAFFLSNRVELDFG